MTTVATSVPVLRWAAQRARLHGLSTLPSVGSASLQEAPEVVAQYLRKPATFFEAARELETHA